MAGELIKLYAARKGQSGYAFSADSPWLQEFEDHSPLSGDRRPALVH